MASSLILLSVLMPLSVRGSEPDEGGTVFPWQDGSAVLVGAYMGGYRNISEGVSAAKDGQTVYIAPGLYRENVLVDKSVRLVGLFDRYIGINGMGGNYAVRMTANGAGIEDIVVLNATNGIEVVSCNDVNITMCKAFYCNIGLSLANCTRTLVDGCTFMRNGGAGMYLADTMDVHVKNTASSENGYGFGMYYAPFTTFENCTASFNSKAGFYLYWLSFGTRILNASCTLNGIGIHVLDVDDVLVKGCDLGINIRYGIHLMSQDSLVENCSISTLEGDGIMVENSERVLIVNNSVQSCETGVVLATSNNISLINNILRDNRIGIKLSRGSNGNTIRMNDIQKSYSFDVSAINCGQNEWSHNYWPDSELNDNDGDGLFDGQYIIGGDPQDMDCSPRAFPLKKYRAVSRIFWEGEPTENRTIYLDGSHSWPPSEIVKYNWTVSGCGIHLSSNSSRITVSPAGSGNLSIELRVWTNSSRDDHYLVILVRDDVDQVNENGPDTVMMVFIALVVIGSISILVVLTLYRRFRRPLPPAPRW